ncbi:hypothetical protein PRIP_10974 [Listeria riparia FSL S10-1204]|uniref:Uncharacterized protein n=1 Tax=Listeria riparia FSL S10-1204 TaxID=1265816 RepID=W7D992_9LIST|nr:hypothetical protein PRIP_10974 [Listeria riparia FSL S10-1204]
MGVVGLFLIFLCLIGWKLCFFGLVAGSGVVVFLCWVCLGFAIQLHGLAPRKLHALRKNQERVFTAAVPVFSELDEPIQLFIHYTTFSIINPNIHHSFFCWGE